MTTQPEVIYARQLLTMVSDTPDAIEEPPDPSRLNALRDRDASVVGLIEDGAIALSDDRIVWVGPAAELPERYRSKEAWRVPCAAPGLIDCHTHAVFAGSRHMEFVQRNLGADYLDILEAGGGILSSAKATAAASRKELAELLVGRCYGATRMGITTLEVKSGYGLATDVEMKQLAAINDARADVLLDLEATFLGAHAIPRKYRERRDDYVQLVCEEMIPRVSERRLARFCDVFCDRGAFTAAEAERILKTGLDYGLIPRIHADELTSAGAAEVAARVGASSADHLEYVSDEAITMMAEASVVAVLLPAVNLYLRCDRYAPARALLNAGVDVALSTDFNPGTAMTQDLGLIMTLGCTMLGMTPGECLRAVTASAARALRLPDRGTLAVGQRADVAMFGVEDYWQIPYVAGYSHVEGVIRAGELVYWRSTEDVDG